MDEIILARRLQGNCRREHSSAALDSSISAKSPRNRVLVVADAVGILEPT